MSKDMSDTWDYRVVRQITEKGITSAGNGDSRLSVQEVYYDDETDEPMAHSIDLQLEGDNIADLRTTLQRMLWCLDKDVVDEIKSELSDYSDTVTSDIRGTVEDRVSFLEQESAERIEEMESLILSMNEKGL